MKNLFLFLALAVFTPLHADEIPTYKSDDGGEYATGLVKPNKPLTLEQHQAKLAFDKTAISEGWSFDYDVTEIGKHATGYVKPEAAKFQAEEAAYMASPLFGADPLRPVDFRTVLGAKAPGILNQGNCGSCVVFSFTGNAQWLFALLGIDIPALSPQHLMNCGGSGGQCSGDYGENVAGRLVKLGALAQATDYPYTARTSSCKDTSGMKKYGQYQSWKTISGSFQSILEALNNNQPVSVGVAADSRFSSYRSGIYNGFGSMGTNHYVLVVGARCGTSVDAAGNCTFDSQGNLAAGNDQGVLVVANSWGSSWGANGFIEMQFENKSGRRNNNIAGGSGNAQIVDTGVPKPPVGPVEFVLETSQGSLHVTIAAGSALKGDSVKAALDMALKSVGE